jgi:hypothetical protein
VDEDEATLLKPSALASNRFVKPFLAVRNLLNF